MLPQRLVVPNKTSPPLEGGVRGRGLCRQNKNGSCRKIHLFGWRISNIVLAETTPPLTPPSRGGELAFYPSTP